jgi:NAD(P)-dependent dehydrogenase (short-subunit alcohol dehydrogenase family)
MAQLEGKVAVVTGGSTGIGLAAAKRFAEAGAHVFITARRQPDLDKAVKEIGKNVTAVQGDVSKLADLDKLYKTIAAEKGVLDIVFANAGCVEHVPLDAITEEHYERVMGVNLKAIVINSSIVGPSKGVPSLSIYSASKAGVLGLMRAWVTYLSAKGIRVNAISPGATDTPIFETQFANKDYAEMARTAAINANPLKRMAHPDELAAAAFFLASDEASYITGVDLQVDGGMAQI